MNKPEKLKLGATIGIVSVSSPATQKTIDNTEEYFAKKGYSVRVGPNALAEFGFLAGTCRQRAEDFNLMLRDPEVRRARGDFENKENRKGDLVD